MAQEKEEILIEIVVANDAALKAISENQQSIERLKETQLELTKARKAGTITEEEYSKKSTAVKVAIDTQKESIRQNEKELRNNIKSQKENNDSLTAMRAQLSNSVKAFDALSKAERESAKGQELQKSIADTVEQLNEAEQATGRFQRQVGNYPNQTSKASQGITQMTGFLGKMSSQVEIISPRISGMINSIGGFASKAGNVASEVGTMNATLHNTGEAANVVEGFAGKAGGSLNNLAGASQSANVASTSAFSSIASGARALGMVFLTPPVIIIAAIILAIVAAFKLLQLGFERNDKASDSMAESMAVLEPIMDAVAAVASYLAEGLANIVHIIAEVVSGTIDFIAGLIGMQAGLRGAAQESMQLRKDINALEDAEREFSVKSAERSLRRAKLLSEVADKEKFTAEERIARLKDASKLDEADLEDKKRLAFENYRIIVQTAKKESDTSDETADKIAEARIRALKANQDYFEGKKEINKKLSAAENELSNEQTANYEKWKQQHDEKLKKETDAIRHLEDLVIANIKDEYQRQIEAEKAKTTRANEDLQKRLDSEKNLTNTARKAINDTILINEQNLINKVNELTEKSLDANIKKEIDAKTKEYEAKLQLAEKGSQDELNIKQAKLLLERDALLLNDELTNVQRLAIEDKYNKDSQALKDNANLEKYNKLQQQLDKEFEIKLLDAELNKANDVAKKEIELEEAQAHHNALVNMDDATKEALKLTQEDYEIAIKKSNKALIDSENAVMLAKIEKMEADLAIAKNIANNFSTILAFAEQEGYEAAQFAKALALVNIGIALAEGIAGAVKAASKATTWYEMAAAIVAGVASVVTAISSAKSALKETPKPPKPNSSSSKKQAFATGGIVRGSGTGTSDSIDARLSNGESVMNANSTSMFTPLLSALNQAGGGVGFGSQQVSNQLAGEDMLARAFARGVAMLPNPVVSVKEINTVNDRFTLIKEL